MPTIGQQSIEHFHVAIDDRNKQQRISVGVTDIGTFPKVQQFEQCFGVPAFNYPEKQLLNRSCSSFHFGSRSSYCLAKLNNGEMFISSPLNTSMT